MSHYAKRWGAEPRTRGQYHFRLWAPAHPHITLVLAGRDHRMDAAGDGWFEAETAGAPGDAYAFRLPSGLLVPDPASRQQQGDVHGPSRLVDPHAFDWKTPWNGRPWHETVHYEAHVGTFTPEGTFEGVLRKLDHLAALGITALELCPVAQFGGTRGWGYDGVLLYAPHVSYGTPDDLKRLVDAAHARGLMVFLDVVYNHFGPDGNYLASYAPQFFHPERHTPWGAAIAYDLKPVRDFYTDNARFWLEEYRIDGLRLDAVDQIDDQSPAPILQEIARAVRDHSFAYARHLTTEDDRNIVSMHRRDDDGRPVFYDGEWNDDFHHVAHVIATAESGFYYHDFASDPRRELLRALTGGFAYQGQASPFRGGMPRGQESGHLPPVAFVNFLQNHDQIGNRPMGDRLTVLAMPEAVEALTAVLLLSPMVPLVFMGEEWAERRPFLFFSDFQGELADAVREGRRVGMQSWPGYQDAEFRATIPDPNDPATFARSKLDWDASHGVEGAARLALFRCLLAIRAAEITPRLATMRETRGTSTSHGTHGIEVSWTLGDGARLTLVANLGGLPFGLPTAPGRELFASGSADAGSWFVRVTLQ